MKKKISKKKFLILLTGFFVIFSSLIFLIEKSSNVYADKYDDEIRVRQAQNETYSARIAELNSQSLTLANNIAELETQSAYLQNQIDISQLKYDKLSNQIAQTEKQIKDSSDALGTTLADMYIDDNISTIELIASSNNISDFLDKQEFRNSIKENLSSKIAEIKKLKSQLESDKLEVEKVLNDQKIQRDELSRRQYNQAKLLADTKGQESNYQSLISVNMSKIAEAKAIQALINSRARSTGGYQIVDSGLLTSYPWNSSNCPMVGFLSSGGSNGSGGDDNGYGCRQCASYVAWRIAKETGRYYRWGNAVDFTNNAISQGYKEGDAQAGSIAVLNRGQYGHVAWVEAVDGDRVLVSQYNFDYGAGYGMYSKMWLSKSFFDHYVKII